jgi:hypothetical protein
VTTGHIMPVSGRVKELASADWNWRQTAAQLVRIDVRQIWKVGLIAGAMVVARNLWRRRISGLGVYATGAIAICAYYQLSYTTGFSAAFWYYGPLYILCSYALALALGWWIALMPQRRTWLIASAALLLFAILTMRVMVIRSYLHRGEGERAHIYRLALRLREQRGSDSAAAWDAGILGYYGGSVTNLDGLVNSADYLERYLSRGRTADYITEHRFKYLVCYESYTWPNGRASGVLADYRQIYSGDNWVILERKD